MSITEDEALQIAKEHGLSARDGLSLSDLARDADQAERIAAVIAEGDGGISGEEAAGIARQVTEFGGFAQ